MHQLQFNEEASASPLWRPAPGTTYYMALGPKTREMPEVWIGGEEDEKRHAAGLVFKSLGRAHAVRCWTSSMVKLWQLSALYENQYTGDRFAIGVLGQKLEPYATTMATAPTFPTLAAASLAIEELTESERNALIRGPLWT